MHDISSTITVLYVCVFQRWIYCPKSLTHCLCSSLFMFLHSRVKNCALCMTYHRWSSFFMFVSWEYFISSSNIWHIIYDHLSLCLCLPELNIVSFIYDISSKTTVLYVCVLQRWICCPNVWHIVYVHRCLCLCVPELETVSLMYEILFIVVILYVCLFQR